MLSGHGSAWRRRRNSRAARIAVPLAIPMALGLTLGIILAVSGGNTTTIAAVGPGLVRLGRRQRGACGEREPGGAGRGCQRPPAAAASAPARVPAPRRPASAAPVPCPSASGSAAASAPATVAAAVAGIPPINPAGRVGLAGSNAVDAAGNAFSFTQTASRGGGLDELHGDRAGPPADRPGPGHAVGARGRLHLGQRRHRGRVHRRHDPGAERPAPGVQPAGDQPGHHPGRGAHAADDRARVRRSSSASGSTATRWPWSAGARGRATASTPSATR